MKRLLGICLLVFVALIGCSQEKVETVKVGLVTGEMGLDDKSFSEITWKGITEFASGHENVEIQYVTPKDTELATLVNAVDNLVLSGNEVVVLTGFVFEETAGQVAKAYPDVKFILIDGQPSVKGEYKTFDNVLSIFFTEHEAGFLSGVASALETKTGKLGFLGGVEVPAVQKYGWGYLTGVAFANQYFDLDTEVLEYLYQGTFSDFSAGQAISGGMFDKGIDIIQHAGGAVGSGAIVEAKQRENVYIVGVDTDQYFEGSKGDNSVILTSAMKHINVAVVEHLEKYIKGEFKGGQVITMDITQNAVGLPNNNPNLSANTCNKLEEVKQLLKQGEIKVPSTKEETRDFLDKYNYDYSDLNF